MRDHLQLFSDIEVMFVAAQYGAIAYMILGHHESAVGLIAGYITATIYYSFDYTFDHAISEITPASFEQISQSDVQREAA